MEIDTPNKSRAMDVLKGSKTADGVKEGGIADGVKEGGVADGTKEGEIVDGEKERGNADGLRESETEDGVEESGTTDGVNGAVLKPVAHCASGEGLPYAPEDWPTPGDIWKWKVGRRTTPHGFHMDRYLYPPRHLQVSRPKRPAFKSKLSVREFIEKEFPGTDVNEFFATFSWKIPSKMQPVPRGQNQRVASLTAALEKMGGHTGSDLEPGTVGCKAGNSKCCSLVEETRKPELDAMECNICCSEPDFCRYCCCILCFRPANCAYGGYSFVKCEGKVDGNICWHVAHVNCALRSYMAGTVGGSIGLDAEYYCRRCDARTELISHVSRIIETCKSMDSRDEIEKILNVGVCILRGSQKESAKRLLIHIQLAMAKLKSGTCLEDIWKEDYILDAHSDQQQDPPDVTIDLQVHPHVQSKYLELGDEIDEVLFALRRSQELEYEVAEERLNSQKDYLLDLSQLLEREKAELLRCSPSSNSEFLHIGVSDREAQIKREKRILRDMEEVAMGFGKTPKRILKEHFSLELNNKR